MRKITVVTVNGLKNPVNAGIIAILSFANVLVLPKLKVGDYKCATRYLLPQ